MCSFPYHVTICASTIDPTILTPEFFHTVDEAWPGKEKYLNLYYTGINYQNVVYHKKIFLYIKKIHIYLPMKGLTRLLRVS